VSRDAVNVASKISSEWILHFSPVVMCFAYIVAFSLEALV